MDSDSAEYQRHIAPTLLKLQYLQEACRRAGMPVPIDDLLAGKSEISPPPGTFDEAEADRTEGGSTTTAAAAEDEDEPEMTAQELGDHIGRRISTLVVILAATLYLYRPPPSSPLYHIPGMLTLLPPR